MKLFGLKKPDNEWTKKTIEVLELAGFNNIIKLYGEPSQGNYIQVHVTKDGSEKAIIESKAKIGTEAAYDAAAYIHDKVMSGEWLRGWKTESAYTYTIGADGDEPQV